MHGLGMSDGLERGLDVGPGADLGEAASDLGLMRRQRRGVVEDGQADQGLIAPGDVAQPAHEQGRGGVLVVGAKQRVPAGAGVVVLVLGQVG